jgi:hypothetical protein
MFDFEPQGGPDKLAAIRPFGSQVKTQKEIATMIPSALYVCNLLI